MFKSNMSGFFCLAFYFFGVILQPATADSLMFQSDLERTGVYDDYGPEEDPSIVWMFDAVSAIFNTPLVYEGGVYFSDFEGGVYAVAKEDGALVWEKDLGGQPSFQISLGGDFLLVGRLSSRENGESFLMAIDRMSGEERWRFDVEDFSGVESPVIYDERVFLVSMSGYIFALDLETGDEIWKYSTNGGLGQILISEDVLYYQDEKGVVYALSKQEGELLWRHDPSNEKDSLFSVPVIEECCIYVMALKEEGGEILKIGKQNGEVEEIFPTLFKASPSLSLADGVIFFGDDGEGHAGAHGYMNAMSAESGEMVWRFETEGFVRGAASIAGDTVYFGSHDHFLYAVDRHTGEKKWRYETGEGIASAPAVVDGRVYFGSIDGHVYVLE